MHTHIYVKISSSRFPHHLTKCGQVTMVTVAIAALSQTRSQGPKGNLAACIQVFKPLLWEKQ